MRGKCFWAVAICLFSLGITSCEKKEETKQIHALQKEDVYYPISSAVETEDGIYYVEWDNEKPYHTIYYIDKKTEKKTVLCQKVNCRHDSKECQAIAEEPNVMGCIFCWDGKLYFMICGIKENVSRNESGQFLALYSMNGDGTGKKLVHTFEHATIYPNALGLYQGKLFLAAQTMQKLEDGSGETSAEPSILSYDLKTNQEMLIMDGVKEKGKYTIPCGASGDSVYLSQISWEDNAENSACTYLEYNFKTKEFHTLYETIRKNSGNAAILNDTLYLQPDAKRVETYHLRTKKQEPFLELKADADSFFSAGPYIGLIKQEEVEEGGFKRYYNWYDIEEGDYLFDDYQDGDRIWINLRLENGYLGEKDGTLCFYYPENQNWKEIEEVK